MVPAAYLTTAFVWAGIGAFFSAYGYYLFRS
jgi:hypothetical protein